MAERDHVTRCKQWYELNLGALRLRELHRAGGWPTALLGAVFWRLPGLIGKQSPGGMLFPEEVTLVWDVPLGKIEEPEELLEAGFHMDCAFELPEFTGDNVTVLLHDRARTTYCEAVHASAEGVRQTGLAFSSHLPGKKPVLLKTVQTWKTSPLIRPEGFPCQCVPGTAEETYQAHREWLATFRQKPEPTSAENFFELSRDNHRTLMDHYADRNVYVEARPELVKNLFRQKKLKRAGRDPESRQEKR